MNVFEEIKQDEIDKKKIRSKLMFDDDFFGHIETLIEQIEEEVVKKIIPNYRVEYTNYGNYEAKIKIADKEKHIFKLINIKLTYRKNDVKFGYINPEIISDEKGQKTRIHKLGKFSILEHDEILKIIIQKLIEIIEEF